MLELRRGIPHFGNGEQFHLTLSKHTLISPHDESRKRTFRPVLKAGLWRQVAWYGCKAGRRINAVDRMVAGTSAFSASK